MNRDVSSCRRQYGQIGGVGHLGGPERGAPSPALLPVRLYDRAGDFERSKREIYLSCLFGFFCIFRMDMKHQTQLKTAVFMQRCWLEVMVIRKSASRVVSVRETEQVIE